MVKHIVMWKLKDSAEGASKENNIKKMKTELESLPGKVDVIKALEVGLDFNRSDAAYDIVLYSEFESQEALNTYQKHPEHVKVAEFIGTLRAERVVVDYEI